MIPLLMLGSAGCSKSVEDAQKKLLIQIMTNGRWVVQTFSEETQVLTAEFNGYEFQFYENGKVDGIKGTQVTSGTWAVDAVNYTIQSNFPQGNTTLQRLNETWRITNSTPITVEARPVSTARNAYLKLNKQ
jgi:hypothetical protein